MQSSIFRDNTGWRAESLTNFRSDKELEVVTCRQDDGKLMTVVRAWSKAPGSKLRGHKLGHDFAKVLAVSHPTRITESIVARQHESVVAKEEELRLQAELFYNAQKSAEKPTAAA